MTDKEEAYNWKSLQEVMITVMQDVAEKIEQSQEEVEQ